MKVLFDTSVFVAAFLPNREAHQESVAWIAAAKAGAVTLTVSAHTLAEIYSVLTRLPPRFALEPAIAFTLIETNVLGTAKLRTLTSAQYTRVVKRLAGERIAGGIIYDALIAEVARLEKVDLLVTLNPDHFRRVWPDAANRIISPVDQPPPASN